MCSEGEAKTLTAGDFTPTTEGQTQAGEANSFTAAAGQTVRVVLTPTDTGVTLQSASLTVQNVDSLKVLYYFSGSAADDQPTEQTVAVPAGREGAVNVDLKADQAVDKVEIVAEGPASTQSPSTLTLQQLTGCAKRESLTHTAFHWHSGYRFAPDTDSE